MDFLNGGCMRLITSIYTNKQLNTLAKYLDYALLEIEGTSLNYKDLDLDLAIDFCKENSIGIILSMDKIFLPNEIEIADKYLKQYKDKVDYFYATDLGVCNLAIEYGIENKIIFDPKTMITNSFDYEIYSSYGFHALGVSSEIMVRDLIQIQRKTMKNTFYQVFGHRLMFYSKRHLISLYSQKNNENYPKEDVLFKESTRTDYFPGTENINGTILYRSYLISLLKELNNLSSIAYGFLESYRVDDLVMIEVLKIYKDALNGKNIDELLNQMNQLGLNIEDGFTYKDSVYQKEELKL